MDGLRQRSRLRRVRRANVTGVIPLRRNSGIRESSLPRKSDEWRRLYRGAVERGF